MGISLVKGQRISLEKQDKSALSNVTFGLGWDPVNAGFWTWIFGSTEIDLDASCILFDQDKNPVDIVYYGQLRSKDNSIQHTGDNLTGEGDGDDESIKVALNRIPPKIKYLAFTINSFQGQTFDKIDNAFCRLIDTQSNKEICRYTLSEKGAHTGVIMAILYRHDGDWKLRAVGDPANGRTARSIVNLVKSIL
jgi:tellurium resistance protein TerZ